MGGNCYQNQGCLRRINRDKRESIKYTAIHIWRRDLCPDVAAKGKAPRLDVPLSEKLILHALLFMCIIFSLRVLSLQNKNDLKCESAVSMTLRTGEECSNSSVLWGNGNAASMERHVSLLFRLYVSRTYSVISLRPEKIVKGTHETSNEIEYTICRIRECLLLGAIKECLHFANIMYSPNHITSLI